MKRHLPILIAAGLVAGFVGLASGEIAARLSPAALAQALLRNPFGLTGRVGATGPVVVEQVQRLQRLETCRYQGQVIVEGENKGLLPTWLAGDQMLFVGRGEVVAGVDLANVTKTDVQVEGARVAIRLPAAEILHASVDSRASQVYERRSGILTGPDQQLETRVRIEAEDRLRSAALESGVLSTADQNARDTVRRQLELLGFREVRFL